MPNCQHAKKFHECHAAAGNLASWCQNKMDLPKSIADLLLETLI
jgi:hypothetical protein